MVVPNRSPRARKIPAPRTVPGTSQNATGTNQPKDQYPFDLSRELASGPDSQGENKANGSDAQSGKAAGNERSPGETQSKTNQETPGSPCREINRPRVARPTPRQGNNQPRDAAHRQGGSTKGQNSATQDREQGGSKQGNTQGTSGSERARADRV